MFLLPLLLARAELGGEVLDGLAALEVAPYDLRHIPLRQAEVPGTSGVDDGVRAVLAEAEAADGVHADVPHHAPPTQLFLERLADLFRAALLAVAAAADEHVGVVLPDLRAWSRVWRGREGSGLLRLLRLLLGDLSLRTGSVRRLRRHFLDLAEYTTSGGWGCIMGRVRVHPDREQKKGRGLEPALRDRRGIQHDTSPRREGGRGRGSARHRREGLGPARSRGGEEGEDRGRAPHASRRGHRPLLEDSGPERSGGTGNPRHQRGARRRERPGADGAGA